MDREGDVNGDIERDGDRIGKVTYAGTGVIAGRGKETWAWTGIRIGVGSYTGRDKETWIWTVGI